MFPAPLKYSLVHVNSPGVMVAGSLHPGSGEQCGAAEIFAETMGLPAPRPAVYSRDKVQQPLRLLYRIFVEGVEWSGFGGQGFFSRRRQFTDS